MDSHSNVCEQVALTIQDKRKGVQPMSAAPLFFFLNLLLSAAIHLVRIEVENAAVIAE
jgi:hypothetical protein